MTGTQVSRGVIRVHLNYSAGGLAIAGPSTTLWLFSDQPEYEIGTTLPSTASGRETSVKKVVALLVEDNRADVLIVEEAIAVYGLPIELHVVNDGAKAFEFIERAERAAVVSDAPACANDASCHHSDGPIPDLLLLDLNLPVRSGKEVLMRVRASAKFSMLPVLVITSSNAPKDRKEMEELGVNGYFCKPADYDGFLKVGAALQALLEFRGN